MDDKAQQFLAEYQALVAKYGYRLTPVVELVPTNHGTYELAADLKITPIRSSKPADMP